MNYKVGDEVLVKAVINDICVGDVHPYEVRAVDNSNCGSSARVIYVREEDVLPVPDMTVEETWELARRIVGCCEHGLEETKRREIFSRDDAFDVFNLFTEHEAKARIEAWEAEKEIKVGDVVRVTLGKLDEGETDTALITWVHENNWYDLIMKNGLGWTYVNGERIKKTCRHIDIEGLLKQIGGIE